MNDIAFYAMVVVVVCNVVTGIMLNIQVNNLHSRIVELERKEQPQ